MKSLKMLGWLVVAICSFACTSSSTPTQRAPAAVAPTAEPAAPVTRWLPTNGRALIGPAVPGGTLVLLGGRRAVVASDGHLELEKVPAPERFSSVVAVPTPEGPVLVGLGVGDGGDGHLYRFDDPLSAPTPLVELCEDSFAQLRTRAGTVEITGLGTGIAAFDPRTGARLCGLDPKVCRKDRARPTLPECPPAAPVAEERPPAPRSPPLLHWIAATGRDPLALAVTDGARLDERTAVVASNGLVARVDLADGSIVELVPYDEKRPADDGSAGCGFCSDRPPRDEYGPCEVARAGRELWFFCPWTGKLVSRDDRYRRLMPFGVLAVQAHPGKLTVKPGPTFGLVGREVGRAHVWSSATGALLLHAPCNLDEREAILMGICVRQPDGSLSTFAGSIGAEWPNHTMPRGQKVPLHDGRLAAVFGTYSQGDSHSEPIRVETIGPHGERSTLPTFPIGFPEHTTVKVTSVEESEGRLDVALWGSELRPGATVDPGGSEAEWRRRWIRVGWLVHQPLDGRPAAVRRIPHAEVIAVGRGHAIAIVAEEGGAPRALLSNDGGATLLEEAAPKGLHLATRVLVGEVGTFFDHGRSGEGWLRIGWDPLSAR